MQSYLSGMHGNSIVIMPLNILAKEEVLFDADRDNNGKGVRPTDVMKALKEIHRGDSSMYPISKKIMRRIFLFIACLFISGTLCSVKAAAPMTNVKVPILVYHHIRPQQGWTKLTWSWKMTVSPSVFEQQMKWIADHGYKTLDLTTAEQILKGEIAGPVKPLVVTFDDNNQSAYDQGLPILKKYGHTAAFYIVTNRLQNPTVIDAARVKDLVAQGMDIESHTISHSTLTRLTLKKLDHELKESRRILEELTGKPVLHLAYPSTAQNKTVRERAKLAGYRTATIMDPRPATPKDDLLKLPRIMMTDDTNLSKVLP